MLHPHVVDAGSSFQIGKVAVSISDVQLQAGNKEFSSDMEVHTLYHKKTAYYEMSHGLRA
jgi:S-ribosylhomocysteine lyase LuxS involved in autoinducer biosynthesis